MNERIRQLYDQAIIIEDGGDYMCGELDLEKFAKLIVQECANLGVIRLVWNSQDERTIVPEPLKKILEYSKILELKNETIQYMK